ncbi:MAG TPA: HAMP domain-containing sensor histidine kinase, partial [Chitinophagaceae bacterium]
NIKIQDKEGVISMTNVLREKVDDTIRQRMKGPSMMLVKVNHNKRFFQTDSATVHYRTFEPGSPNKVFEFLAGVDSLRDSLTIKDVTDRFHKVLVKEKIELPFVIKASPGDTSGRRREMMPMDFDDNTVSVGFTKPVLYRLEFPDSNLYLLKRIAQPILISVLLLGVTILSFLLLYRNLRQQRRLAQIKNDFIGNITHELKTPIATVSVAVEALRNFNALDDPQRTGEYLDISANELQRLSLLVDKVLKLSMFENREIVLNKESFDIVQLAKEVMASMKLQFEKQHAVTKIETTGTNFAVTADRLHMTSVLYNLLDNALKYSSKDPHITVHIIDREEYLELRIIDNGIGIAREYKNKVFEKFFRVPSGNRHNIKGYGLGLSYVSHILQRHMGFIEVESELNKGSAFIVRLPFEERSVVHYDRGRSIRKRMITIKTRKQ